MNCGHHGFRGLFLKCFYIIGCVGLLFTSSSAWAKQLELHVYGPGGPLPAMKMAAQAFSKSHRIKILVEAGPIEKWRDQAMANGDLIYSGSENMMTSYLQRLPDLVDVKTIIPAYLRPAAILVHPGNPLHIKNFRDLLKPGVRVMVVQGAGQTGLWEDIAGKNGNLNTIRRLRANIVYFAPNSAEALQRWTGTNPPDAWIIYNIWQIAHPQVADLVPLGPRHILYRDMDISLTKLGKNNPEAQAFYHFLLSRKGAAIFKKYGWSE